MNGVHDLGGLHGFGPVVPEPHEPVFHAGWERRTFALALATARARVANFDEFRRTVERMPPADYLAASYYERWLHALEALLVDKQIISRAEIEARIRGDHIPPAQSAPLVESVADHPGTDLASNPQASAARPSGSLALRHDPKFKARFKPGDRVIARNLNPEGHTRLPRYARGHRGVIRRDWGTFVFPDTHAHGAGANPQHCYAVEFGARELWGSPHPGGERVNLDLWEAYLAPDAPAAAPQRPSSRPAARAPIVKAPKANAKKRQLKKPHLKKTRVERTGSSHIAAKRAPAVKTRTPRKARKRR